MKRVRLISILALAAGLFLACSQLEAPLTGLTDKLTVSPASAKISTAGTASFTFTLTLLNGQQVVDLSHYVATIKFEGVNGSVSPASATTDASGVVSVTFTAPNPESFTGGSVKGTVIKVSGD